MTKPTQAAWTQTLAQLAKQAPLPGCLLGWSGGGARSGKRTAQGAPQLAACLGCHKRAPSAYPPTDPNLDGVVLSKAVAQVVAAEQHGHPGAATSPAKTIALAGLNPGRRSTGRLLRCQVSPTRAAFVVFMPVMTYPT